MTGVAWGDARNSRRARLRSSLLWIAATVLGAASVYHTGMVVHDDSQRREAARLLVMSTGHQIAGTALVRLERMGRDAIECGCAAGLPVQRVFRADLKSGRLVSMPPREVATNTGGAPAATQSTARDTVSPVTDSLLLVLSRAAASEMSGVDAPRLRLSSVPSVPATLAVLVIGRNLEGQAIVMQGLLVDAPQLASAIFTPSPISDHARGLIGSALADSMGPLVRLDARSMRVTDLSARPLYGALDTTRTLRASFTLRGALTPLRLELALAPGQLAPSLVSGVRKHELWLLGALQLSTIILLGLAVGSTRREALLARARSDFVAGVSHDLRMPLAQILLSSETLALERARNDAERASLVTSIVREARRLVALIDNVLLFARSGSVVLKPVLTPIAVSELFDDATDAVQLMAEERGQAISADPGPQLTVLGDRHLVRQAIVNLLDNALKYGRDGQCVQLRASKTAPGIIQIHVDDLGLGVPAADRQRVFEPYERLARDQASERTGTGLGLSIVRDVAQACQGRCWLEARDGGGTRAILELRAAGVT